MIAQVCAFAGFWHIYWLAGVAFVAFLVFGLLGVAVHSAGYTRLEYGDKPPPQNGEGPSSGG